MSSIAEPFQRDEWHLFLAVVLHLAVGLLIYAFLVTGERRPQSVMLEGLPIVFGKMVSQGDRDGDAPKTLAKSDPVQAQGVAPEKSAETAKSQLQQQQQPANAAEAKPIAPRTGTVAAATPPVTPETRTVQPVVTNTQPRPPAAVALDSPVGQPAAAANLPTLRLQPDPEEAARTPPPVDASAARTVEAPAREPPKTVPPAAAKAPEEAKAKLANVPGVKPAIVPQLDSRPSVAVPPKPVERKPEEPKEPEVKVAETKQADQAKAAAASTTETQTAVPPAVQKPVEVDAAKADPPDQATPPAAVAVVQPKATVTATTPPPDVAPPVAVAQPKSPETVTTPPAEVAAAQVVPEVQARAEEALTPETDSQAAGGIPVPRQRAEEPELPVSEAPGGQEQASATPETTATPSGGNAGGNTGGQATSAGAKSQTASDRFAAMNRKLGGLGQGKSGAPSGQSASGSALAAMQATGSRLAQSCLDRAKVFKFGDDIAGTFNVQIDRGLRRLRLLDFERSRGNPLSRPRIAEISAALNNCGEFKKFVLEQPGLTTFSFAFASGQR